MVTNQDITESAFRLFANKGFHETTTEDIAKSLGLKKQSLYSHFKSKNEIILAVLQEHSENIQKVIDEIIAEYSDHSIEILLKFIFVKLTIYLSQRDRLLFWKRIFYFDKNGEFSEILKNNNWQFDRKLHAELFGILSARYPQFNNREKMRSFFLSYMIIIHGYLDWMLIAGYADDTIESTWDNFWQGVKSMF